MKKIFILFLVSFLLITCKKVAFDILYVDAPAVTTDSVNNIKLDSATVYFKINNPSNFKFVKVGVCYDTSTNNPNINNMVQLTDSGVVKGNLKIPIANLKYNTKYYARGFAIFNDSIFYGNVQTFTTNTLPTIALNINNITNSSATINWVITNSNRTNFTKVGIYYSTSNMLPGTNNNDSTLVLNNTGALAGTYSLDVQNLITGSIYYIRYFYIINGVQYVSPQVQSFTAIFLPTIATNSITNITKYTATTGITITNVGNVNIAAAGLCYSKTNTIPTLADSLKTLANTGVLSGIYPIYLSNLSFNTVYYVRSYYTVNGLTYYGNVQNFTTLQNIPQVQTDTAINITNNSATINFSITNETALNITAAGIAYSSSNTSPTTASGYVAHSSTGNLAGNYILPLSSLSANTIYYYRAYINYNGTIYYGAVQTFTTTNLLTTLTLANLESNMVTIPAGSFTMGATSEQLANNGDGFSVFWSPTTQQVTLSTYKICRFEVTQQLWRDVMGNNPSYFNGGSYGTNLQRPVELVSWNDCQTFITKLNQLTGKSYRLPTEAEWEYVARGGLNSTYSYIYSGSNSLNDVAWNINNSSGQTQTVGTKQANALGLYDMTGNVWELCSDWYGNYSNTGVTNPQGPPTGTYRILRGGSFPNQSSLQRTSLRYSDLPTIRNYTLGFRLVLDNTILPTITTNAVTSITNSTATANINISNPIGLSITATGVAYSSSNSTPTTADAYIAHSSTGNLAGNYTLNLSSLSANTTYYVRGYINYNGTIYYGAVQSFTTIIDQNSIPTNGLITYWPFNSNTDDLSGNNNYGTLINSFSYTFDRKGVANSALNLSASNSSMSSNITFNNPQIFTVSLWVKTLNTTKLYSNLLYSSGYVKDTSKKIIYFASNNQYDRSLNIYNDLIEVYYHYNGGYYYINTGANLFDFNWHHIVYTLDLNGSKIYIDGIKKLNSAQNFAQNFNGKWILGSLFNANNFSSLNNSFIGSYDDIRIYNRVLTDNEILSLYNE